MAGTQDFAPMDVSGDKKLDIIIHMKGKPSEGVDSSILRLASIPESNCALQGRLQLTFSQRVDEVQKRDGWLHICSTP